MQSVSSNAVAQAFSWQEYNIAEALSYIGFQFINGYSGDFSIDSCVKTSNLLIMSVAINNVQGSNIGTSNTAVIGTTNIRPKSTGTYGATAIAIDYRKTSAQVRLGLFSNGNFLILESNGVTSGSNAIRGCMVIAI